MDILSTIFWVVVIIIWIVSALARKRPGTFPEGEQPLAEGEGYRKPEEALERFLRRLSGEEKIQVVPSIEKRAATPFPRIEEKEVVRPQVRTQVKAEEPVYKPKPPEKREAVRSLLPGILDIPAIRQGIILSEILGPPRAERPL